MSFINCLKRISTCLVGMYNRFGCSTRRAIISCVSLVIVLSAFVSVMSKCDFIYAVGVSVNGQNCGYVSSTVEADKAVDSLITHDSTNKPSLDYSHTVVMSSQIISADELAENIINTGDIGVKVTCIVVNGQPMAHVDSVEDAYNKLSMVLGNNTFYNTIEISECLVEENTEDKHFTFDELKSAMVTVDIEYQVNSGDTAQSIAEKFNINEADIPAFVEGEKIIVYASIPALSICVYVDREHKSATSVGGKSGYNVDTLREQYINGIKCSSEIVSTRFDLKYPNKPTATRVVSAGNKGFCWPVDTGYTQYISSFWGDDRGHQGYDIAAKAGTPILSAKAGRVVSVNSMGSAYGKHFVVDHGNGIRTLYAHCSTLYVSVGDTVERGEVVALVGRTGRVTGTHLHFEVFKNGVKVDPINYIGKR